MAEILKKTATKPALTQELFVLMELRLLLIKKKKKTAEKVEQRSQS